MWSFLFISNHLQASGWELASVLSGKFTPLLRASFRRQLCCATSKDSRHSCVARLTDDENPSRINPANFPDSTLEDQDSPPNRDDPTQKEPFVVRSDRTVSVRRCIFSIREFQTVPPGLPRRWAFRNGKFRHNDRKVHGTTHLHANPWTVSGKTLSNRSAGPVGRVSRLRRNCRTHDAGAGSDSRIWRLAPLLDAGTPPLLSRPDR